MEDERDLVTFTNDDGDDFDLEVLFYLNYEGEEYAVLVDADAEEFECDCGHEHGEGCNHEHGEDCDEDCEGHVMEYFVMKVVTLEDDMEEFQVIEDELPDALRELIQAQLMGEFDADGEYDEDEEDED